jgi:trigger factor
MADEDAKTATLPEPLATDASAVAAAFPEGMQLDDDDDKPNLVQTVDITDAGPCRKHVKVTIDRVEIDKQFEKRFTELTRSEQPTVRGFRPGKAPRKMIEKQYYESVADEVKSQVLMVSLEKLADDQTIAPLSPPEFDPRLVSIPKEGPFVYEFDIEVRPEFELPAYKGMKLRKPVHTYTPAEIEAEKKRILEPYGQLVPKESGVVELYDVLTADVSIAFQGKEINKLSEVRVKVEPQLALSDGVAEDFGAKMVGAKAGDVRTADITLAQDSTAEHLRGAKVQATFTVQDVKTTRLPELTREFLETTFGVSTPDGFSELVESVLGRRLEYTQRNAARQQVLEQISTAANWELPQEMLRKQARKTLARRVMEMRNSGMSEERIAGQRKLLEQDSLASTAAALKEHFVLQKVAEVEKIEIEDGDIDNEIERIADQSGESYRKVKARLEKEDLMEAVAADLLERKALDLILSSAEYEEYELKPQADGVAAVDANFAPAAPAAPANAETSAS